MSYEPLTLLRSLRKYGAVLDDDENEAIKEIKKNFELYCRIARAGWLKHHYGRLRIPPEFFQVIVDADITTEMLSELESEGGINKVYWACKTLFGGGKSVDTAGIREFQTEIKRSREKTCLD